MRDTIVFIDAGFLSKLSKHFGGGKYLNYNLLKLPGYLSEKEGLICKKSFYYTAPPFTSSRSNPENDKRKKDYDRFVRKMSQDDFVIREGRCQRLKIDGKFIYKQKGVDSLMVMDLLDILIDFENINKVILIASDSDFVPVIEKLKSRKVKTVLYTYYERGRSGNFCTNNELIKSVNKYVLLEKKDFEECRL